MFKTMMATAACTLLLASAPALAQRGNLKKGEIAYVCPNGDSFTVLFGPADGAATLVRRGETMEMQRQPTESGFLYATGNTNIIGTAEQVTLNVPGFPPLTCRSR